MFATWNRRASVSLLLMLCAIWAPRAPCEPIACSRGDVLCGEQSLEFKIGQSFSQAQ